MSTIYLNNIYCEYQIRRLTSADFFAFPPAPSASALVSPYLWEKYVETLVLNKTCPISFTSLFPNKPFFIDDSLPLGFPLLCTALGQMFSLVKVDLDFDYWQYFVWIEVAIETVSVTRPLVTKVLTITNFSILVQMCRDPLYLYNRISNIIAETFPIPFFLQPIPRPSKISNSLETEISHFADGTVHQFQPTLILLVHAFSLSRSL